MTTAEAVILAIVEGLTEFLPVSSTGHMILVEGLLKMEKSSLSTLYIINIQFGAILAVLVLYWRRFFQSLNFYYKLVVGFIPAGVLGFLLNKYIDRLLTSVFTVAIALIVGGVVLILVDWIFHKQIENVPEDEDIAKKKEINEFGVEMVTEVQELNVSYRQAFIIGCFQTIAMIPGVSRSAITIVGGLTQKFSIKKSAEFSFFLAVPTVCAAALFKLYKAYDMIKGTDIMLMLMGNVISFVVGMLAISFFINLITRFGLKFFGIYRIIIGIVIIILIYTGHKLEITG
jgi:undecaprenyl-diphosphatase